MLTHKFKDKRKSVNQENIARDQQFVPVLITWDVDPDRWTTLERRQTALSMALDLCEQFAIRSTFFLTAKFAHEYPDQIERMLALEQEIGCHGLTHTDEENYDHMTENIQRKYLIEATQTLQTLIGWTIYSFRSPRVKTSTQTLKLLSELGYRSDSSVCSQRIDFVSSNLINGGWLTAPRLPYKPHPENVFRRGNLPIWEIPISAAIMPFISATLKVMGVRWMKALFRLLYIEARYTGKPIVYLAHPSEYILLHGRQKRLTLKELSPSYVRTHGLLARNYLFRLHGQALYEATQELFSYIKSFPDIKFLTCYEFASSLNNNLPSNDS